MFYVYILLMKDSKFYTGSTNDLERRINEHEQGRVKSTSYRRPIELIHYEAYKIESDARRREKYLKTTEGKRLLKKQLKDFLQSLNNTESFTMSDDMVPEPISFDMAWVERNSHVH